MTRYWQSTRAERGRENGNERKRRSSIRVILSRAPLSGKHTQPHTPPLHMTPIRWLMETVLLLRSPSLRLLANKSSVAPVFQDLTVATEGGQTLQLSTMCHISHKLLQMGFHDPPVMRAKMRTGRRVWTNSTVTIQATTRDQQLFVLLEADFMEEAVIPLTGSGTQCVVL